MFEKRSKQYGEQSRSIEIEGRGTEERGWIECEKEPSGNGAKAKERNAKRSEAKIEGI